ncbi:hypothetical protein AXE65_07120 [Ventosimonas gracilis]|uniref:Diguanylate cyclase n=1 Tax=Ventosimonas gracilis TaxID=1680762 RepID=A0A139SJ52_9GAMM|nr:diguanylate cyclase [Ventosimonas gracilis]KXU34605.1 hypothetical protein AXE65_07120 [Ventosimonas gracilis]
MRCLLFIRQPERLPLRWAFLRGSLSVALISVAMVGLTMMLVSVLMLRAYSQHNLRLIARSIAYTVEAAVVFNDVQAAEEALQTIVREEAIAAAVIYDRSGEPLAAYRRVQSPVISWLLGGHYRTAIVHKGGRIGDIELTGHAGELLGFILIASGSLLAGLMLSVLTARYLSQRMVSRVVEPLENMTQITRAIRRDRDFTRHVPQKSNLSELNDLSEDFNALLDELYAWQTHIKVENSLLAHKARHDDLTGLPNRSFFEYRLNLVLQDAMHQQRQAALLFIDCDHFKEINDGLGHAAGDKVLTEVAGRIRRHLRESDLVARLGGDEFAALIYPLPQAKDALRIADAVLQAMNAPIVLNDKGRVSTSLSIGIALYPQHGRSAEHLLRSADVAMYLAKRDKRGSRKLASASDP